jgi:hypothetical protein
VANVLILDHHHHLDGFGRGQMERRRTEGRRHAALAGLLNPEEIHVQVHPGLQKLYSLL